MNATVVAMFICPKAGDPMQPMCEAKAIAKKGLEGDRYCTGEGSFSFKAKGFFRRWLKTTRQVTLVNSAAFTGSGFNYSESRRNIITSPDIELMDLVGRDLRVGTAHFRGIKYCDPCNRPSKLCGKEKSFKEAFFNQGGLIAEVIEGGVIRVGDMIILIPLNY